MQLARALKLVGLPVLIEFDGRIKFMLQQMHIVVNHALTYIEFRSNLKRCSRSFFFYHMNEILDLLDVHCAVFVILSVKDIVCPDLCSHFI